ncbi:ATP-binding protein [Ramlibacter sp.]|uniref:hybrid sensor histidine kinase/response regulator n=1 Tax=Ramlibacter sp. TaxID=1917967 RepID=UPI002615BCBD|nr:ATP-binding protein [Ramlibacter sp.]MDB5956588.1 hybrid sensor histidine kinase/response regulator [Ramlibacter sp.]
MTAGAQGRPLRFRLFLLAASGLLPLAIVAAIVLAYMAGEREREAQQNALAVSRALGTAIDAELRASFGVLQTLAVSDELAAQRLPEFHALVARVAADQGWRAVVLADAQGQVLLSSSLQLNTPRPGPVDPESMQRVLSTKQPVVGNVAVGPRNAGPAFAVRVPVLRQGTLQYVLSAVISVDEIQAVLNRQVMPSTSVVAVFDRKLTRVARTRSGGGSHPSASLQALLERPAPEGTGTTITVEGTRSHTGYSRLPQSGWVVATGISAINASSGYYGGLGAVIAGLIASLALAAFLAWYYSRDLIDPIEALKAAAGALGRGEPVHLPPLGIAELQDVGAALELASAERDRAAQERRAGEAERETLLARATDALHRGEEAGRSKDEFLAMLGHELRNPLAPMATALHLMARKGDPGTRSEREVMERQVAHMKRLVDDLLDVSRITGGRLEMRMQPLRLAELVRHAGQVVQPVLGLRQLELAIAPEAANLWVSGDEVRLAQVLHNLLGNAVKFTGPEEAIRLALQPGPAGAEIVVADSGVGMPPAVLGRVFDLFFQAPQGADRSRGGLGLGLAIVRNLVEMHGGTVRAESGGVGQGSRFIVHLPTVAASRPAPEQQAPGSRAGGQGRVLLVDDNQDAADTAATLLELSGYEVQVAYDPGVALTVLDRFAPDVAVLDVGLPGLSGYELAERLRSHRNGGRCYLVALTGYGTTSDISKAHDAGFDQHLVKPARPEALLEAVRQGMQDHGEKA